MQRSSRQKKMYPRWHELTVFLNQSVVLRKRLVRGHEGAPLLAALCLFDVVFVAVIVTPFESRVGTVER